MVRDASVDAAHCQAEMPAQRFPSSEKACGLTFQAQHCLPYALVACRQCECCRAHSRALRSSGQLTEGLEERHSRLPFVMQCPAALCSFRDSMFCLQPNEQPLEILPMSFMSTTRHDASGAHRRTQHTCSAAISRAVQVKKVVNDAGSCLRYGAHCESDPFAHSYSRNAASVCMHNEFWS